MKYSSPYYGVDPKKTIYLASNDNPYNIPEDIQKEIAKALNYTNRYPLVYNVELEEKISKRHGLKPDNIILGAGSDELLTLLALKYINAGDNTIMCRPSFKRYKDITEFVGGTCREIEHKNFFHDLEAMANAIDENTKIVFICNPNNPTGTLHTIDEIESFIKTIPTNVLVVVDESCFDFVFPKDTNSSIELISKYNNLIVLRTLSKYYALAGLRIGYAISNPQVIDEIDSVKSPYNVSSIAQKAAKIMLDATEFTDKYYNEVQTEKQLYYDNLKELNLEYIPSHSNYIFIKFGENCAEWCKKLKDMNVIVRNCAIFGYPEYVRISIGSNHENRYLLNVLTEMINWDY